MVLYWLVVELFQELLHACIHFVLELFFIGTLFVLLTPFCFLLGAFLLASYFCILSCNVVSCHELEKVSSCIHKSIFDTLFDIFATVFSSQIHSPLWNSDACHNYFNEDQRYTEEEVFIMLSTCNVTGYSSMHYTCQNLNLSIRTCTFPDMWKVSLVVPIYTYIKIPWLCLQLPSNSYFEQAAGNIYVQSSIGLLTHNGCFNYNLTINS